MKNKLTNIFRIAFVILATLVMIITLAFAASASESAEAPSASDEYTYVKIPKDTAVLFNGDSYSFEGGEEAPILGKIVLTGKGSKDIGFANTTGEHITYDVILHEFDGSSLSWYACVSIDNNVTLNLTVYGECYLIADNHPGIQAGENVTINITVAEGATLAVGYSRIDMVEHCIGGDPTINLLSGECSADLESESWSSDHVTVSFSNGEQSNHAYEYTGTDGDVCKKTCRNCDVISILSEHEFEYSPANDQNGHHRECLNCAYTDTVDHKTVFEPLNDTQHAAVCEQCGNEAEPQNHSIDDDGKCVLCGDEAILLHRDENGNEKTFFFMETATEYANENGGTLVVLRDFSAEGKSFYATNLDVTLDFNGKTVTRTTLYIGFHEYTATLRVIDSSEEKTGVMMQEFGIVAYGGTIEINDISGVMQASAMGGDLIINSTKHEILIVSNQNGSSVFLNDISTGKLEIGLRDNENDNSVEINGGSFGAMEIVNKTDKEIYFYHLLKDGYALYGEDGALVNSNSTFIKTPVLCQSHEHDFENVIYSSVGYQHVMGCACGKPVQDASKELHTMGNDGLCQACGIKLGASISFGESTHYYSSIEEVMANIPNESAKIKLYSDAELISSIILRGKDIEIDLNGYTLLLDYLIHVDSASSLALTDTSGKMGRISRIENDTSVIISNGKLTVDGVFINGSLTVSGDGSVAELTVNSGVFKNGITIYNHSSVTVNGGAFKDEFPLCIYAYSPNEFEVTLNGGIYEKGITLPINFENFTLNDLLPKDTGCTVSFHDSKGNPITIEEGEYSEYVTVHHAGATVIKNEKTHYLYCESCDLVFNSEIHTSFVYESSENNEHLVLCGVCRYEVGSEAHSGGKASCTELAICELCDENYGDVNPESHKGGKSSCSSLAVCELCQKEYGEYNGNNHSSDKTALVANGELHETKRECCGQVIKSSKHKYDNACDEDCNECNAPRQVTHVYGTDGKCIGCQRDGGEIKTPKKSIGAGAIIATVLCTLALFGGASFSLIWFVIRKKF